MDQAEPGEENDDKLFLQEWHLPNFVIVDKIRMRWKFSGCHYQTQIPRVSILLAILFVVIRICSINMLYFSAETPKPHLFLNPFLLSPSPWWWFCNLFQLYCSTTINWARRVLSNLLLWARRRSNYFPRRLPCAWLAWFAP